jgi:cell division protein ZapA (FtsZ GTPase activity inhibitor)
MANEIPPSAPGYVTVHIYDQAYHLRGQNPEHIQRLAALVASKMRAVDAKEGRARAAHLTEMLDEVLEDERKVAS